MNIKEKIRILILDDNISDAELMKRELTKAGLDFTSELAQDRQKFLQLLEKFIPNLILADYSLPAFDGMSALRLARERFEDIPVIIVSGAVGEETAIEAVKGGATDYVLKQRLRRLGPVVHRALLEAAVSTKQKQAEEALRESEARFRSVLENSQDVIYRLNVQTGRYEYISPAAERVVGFSSEELMALDVEAAMAMIHPDDLPVMRAELARLEHTGKGEIEYRQRAKNGNYRWISNLVHLTKDSKGRPLYRNGSIRDITDRKYIEEALISSRNLLQNIIDNATSLVYVFDLEGLCIVANKPLAGLLNTSPQMMIGKKREDFIPKDTADQHEANDRKVIKAGKPMEFEEYASFDGRLITFLTTKFPLYKNGNIYAVAGISTDISDRKATEVTLKHDKETFEKMVQERSNELVEAHLELEKTKRLSDIGVLAATVAHELRNPLAAISVAVHNIRRKAKMPDLDKHLDNINKKVMESDQIINNLLFYSRLKPPHFEPIRIAEIIEECMESLGKEVEKEVLITRNLKSIKDVLVEADPLQLREVFNNILNNAYDAVPPEKGRINILAENMGGSVKVVIEDNGHGIDKDILDKIFDPFFTTKAKGTGLGLSICKQIVTMHGGEISVESEPGKGTTISVRLPKKKDCTSPLADCANATK